MLDHIGLEVKDYARSKEFYTQALAPLGLTLLMEFENVAGFGSPGKPFFWIRQGTTVSKGVHVAFSTATRNLVSAFHIAAVAAGGQDNGAPGLRPHYHQNYFGAFVFDPDGNNIEAVCHKPE